MDLNYLYRRHQISLYMAEHAACPNSREAHQGLAEGYAEAIARDRSRRADLSLVA